MLCDTVNKFQSHLDEFCQYQGIVYDHKAEITEPEAEVYIIRTS